MDQVRWLSDAEQRAWRAYLQASHQLFQQLDGELQRDAGLPLAYYQTLAMLSEAPDRTLRMSALAERTWSSRSRLSHAVDRLEEKGWVQRLLCPGDRRGAYAQLTDAGYAVLVAAAPSHVASVRRHLFDLLSDTQVADLEATSERIATSLTCPAEPDGA
jgi:DNA-binding MarR family transcriptional regulator